MKSSLLNKTAGIFRVGAIVKYRGELWVVTQFNGSPIGDGPGIILENAQNTATVSRGTAQWLEKFERECTIIAVDGLSYAKKIVSLSKLIPKG